MRTAKGADVTRRTRHASESWHPVVTIALVHKGGSDNTLTFTLHEMQGGGTYGTTSQPSAKVLATLSGTPASGNITFTCSGCALSANTTYFVKAASTSSTAVYTWRSASAEVETHSPSGNGWSVGYGHFKRANDWLGYTTTWNLAGFVFATK